MRFQKSVVVYFIGQHSCKSVVNSGGPRRGGGFSHRFEVVIVVGEASDLSARFC